MTTSKPNILGYVATKHGKPIGGEDGFFMDEFFNQVRDNPEGLKLEPIILFRDYEALQAECERYKAECEKLRKRARVAERDRSKALKTLKGLEQVARVVSDYSDAVCSENNQLRVECEKLRSIISDLKDWDCDVSGGFLSIPLDLRRRMQEAITAAMEKENNP